MFYHVSMSRRTGHPLPDSHRRSRVACAAALLASAASASAVELNTDNPDLSIRWDNTVRYNLAYRTKSQDPALLASPNFDDGNRNFDKGLVGNRLDLLSEFDLVWRKNTGLRVTAAAWYDHAYSKTSTDNRSVATTNNLVNGVPTLGYNDYVKRFYRGPSGEILDAFAFFKLDAANASFKVGKSVEYWGEALLAAGGTHGISYSQMPQDQAKALAVPGTEIKEIFRPINNITARFSPTDTLTVAAQYFLDWEPTRIPEPGTYFGFSDALGNSGTYLRVLGPYATRRPDVTPKKRGEYGVSARWASSALDATLGFYYRNFADKIGQVHLSDLVPTGLPAPFPPAVPSRYFLAFADDIDLYGISLSKQVGSASVGLEISHRRNMPLVSDAVVVASAAAMPGQGQTNGARGNTWHAVANVVALAGPTPLFDTLALAGELVWSRWESVTRGANVFKGRAAYSGIDKPSKEFVGIGLSATMSWLQVWPGIDLSIPLSYSNGLSGVSAVASGGAKDAGSYGIGLIADISQKHNLALRYSGYFGEYTTNAAGAVTVFNSSTALLRDRGFVSLTYKTTF
jgi:hypothetical protein